MPRSRFCLALLTLLVLAGCGGPSDKDVEQAVRAKLATERHSIEALIGKSGTQALSDLFGGVGPGIAPDPSGLAITVGRKTRLEDGTYSAVVTLKGPKGDPQTITVRLGEAKEGWAVIVTQ